MENGGAAGEAPMVLVSLVEEVVRDSGATLGDVERVIANGAQVNSRSGLISPLMLAVQAPHVGLIELLLRAKANPDVADPKGVRPLHVAAFDGRHDVVKLLADAAADPDARDRHGQTPLFFAPSAGICEMLVSARADVNALNDKGQHAMHLAAHAGLDGAVTWLAQHAKPGTVNCQDKHGRTPAHLAFRVNLQSTVRVLQANGAETSKISRHHSRGERDRSERRRRRDKEERAADGTGRGGTSGEAKRSRRDRERRQHRRQKEQQEAEISCAFRIEVKTQEGQPETAPVDPAGQQDPNQQRQSPGEVGVVEEAGRRPETAPAAVLEPPCDDKTAGVPSLEPTHPAGAEALPPRPVTPIPDWTKDPSLIKSPSLERLQVKDQSARSPSATPATGMPAAPSAERAAGRPVAMPTEAWLRIHEKFGNARASAPPSAHFEIAAIPDAIAVVDPVAAIDTYEHIVEATHRPLRCRPSVGTWYGSLPTLTVQVLDPPPDKLQAEETIAESCPPVVDTWVPALPLDADGTEGCSPDASRPCAIGTTIPDAIAVDDAAAGVDTSGTISRPLRCRPSVATWYGQQALRLRGDQEPSSAAVVLVAPDHFGGMRNTLASILSHASAEGRLEVALKKHRRPPRAVEELRIRAGQSLAKANVDGRLQDAISKAKRPSAIGFHEGAARIGGSPTEEQEGFATGEQIALSTPPSQSPEQTVDSDRIRGTTPIETSPAAMTLVTPAPPLPIPQYYQTNMLTWSAHFNTFTKRSAPLTVELATVELAAPVLGAGESGGEATVTSCPAATSSLSDSVAEPLASEKVTPSAASTALPWTRSSGGRLPWQPVQRLAPPPLRQSQSKHEARAQFVFCRKSQVPFQLLPSVGAWMCRKSRAATAVDHDESSGLRAHADTDVGESQPADDPEQVKTVDAADATVPLRAPFALLPSTGTWYVVLQNSKREQTAEDATSPEVDSEQYQRGRLPTICVTPAPPVPVPHYYGASTSSWSAHLNQMFSRFTPFEAPLSVDSAAVEHHAPARENEELVEKAAAPSSNKASGELPEPVAEQLVAGEAADAECADLQVPDRTEKVEVDEVAPVTLRLRTPFEKLPSTGTWYARLQKTIQEQEADCASTRQPDFDQSLGPCLLEWPMDSSTSALSAVTPAPPLPVPQYYQNGMLMWSAHFNRFTSSKAPLSVDYAIAEHDAAVQRDEKAAASSPRVVIDSTPEPVADHLAAREAASASASMPMPVQRVAPPPVCRSGSSGAAQSSAAQSMTQQMPFRLLPSVGAWMCHRSVALGILEQNSNSQLQRLTHTDCSLEIADHSPQVDTDEVGVCTAFSLKEQVPFRLLPSVGVSIYQRYRPLVTMEQNSNSQFQRVAGTDDQNLACADHSKQADNDEFCVRAALCLKQQLPFRLLPSVGAWVCQSSRPVGKLDEDLMSQIRSTAEADGKTLEADGKTLETVDHSEHVGAEESAHVEIRMRTAFALLPSTGTWYTLLQRSVQEQLAEAAEIRHQVTQHALHQPSLPVETAELAFDSAAVNAATLEHDTLGPDVDELRSKTAATFAQALNDGQLESIVEALVTKKVDSTDGTRQQRFVHLPSTGKWFFPRPARAHSTHMEPLAIPVGADLDAQAPGTLALSSKPAEVASWALRPSTGTWLFSQITATMVRRRLHEFVEPAPSAAEAPQRTLSLDDQGSPSALLPSESTHDRDEHPYCRQPFTMLPSVGAWRLPMIPRRAEKMQSAPLKKPLPNAHVPFQFLPSVGSWMAYRAPGDQLYAQKKKALRFVARKHVLEAHASGHLEHVLHMVRPVPKSSIHREIRPDSLQPCDGSFEVSEGEAMLVIRFAELDFHRTDHAVFKQELLDGCIRCGLPEPEVSRFRVRLREGSIVVDLIGSQPAVLQLKKAISDTPWSIMGCLAMVESSADPHEDDRPVPGGTPVADEILVGPFSDEAAAAPERLASGQAMQDAQPIAKEATDEQLATASVAAEPASVEEVVLPAEEEQAPLVDVASLPVEPVPADAASPPPTTEELAAPAVENSAASVHQPVAAETVAEELVQASDELVAGDASAPQADASSQFAEPSPPSAELKPTIGEPPVPPAAAGLESPAEETLTPEPKAAPVERQASAEQAIPELASAAAEPAPAADETSAARPADETVQGARPAAASEPCVEESNPSVVDAPVPHADEESRPIEPPAANPEPATEERSAPPEPPAEATSTAEAKATPVEPATAGEPAMHGPMPAADEPEPAAAEVVLSSKAEEHVLPLDEESPAAEPATTVDEPEVPSLEKVSQATIDTHAPQADEATPPVDADPPTAESEPAVAETSTPPALPEQEPPAEEEFTAQPKATPVEPPTAGEPAMHEPMPAADEPEPAAEEFVLSANAEEHVPPVHEASPAAEPTTTLDEPEPPSLEKVSQAAVDARAPQTDEATPPAAADPPTAEFEPALAETSAPPALPEQEPPAEEEFRAEPKAPLPTAAEPEPAADEGSPADEPAATGDGPEPSPAENASPADADVASLQVDERSPPIETDPPTADPEPEIIEKSCPPAVAEQEPQVEEAEEHRRSAREALAAAVAARDIKLLRAAISEGESVSLGEHELDQARQALLDAEAKEAEAQLRGRVRDALAAAVSARDISMLRAAISEGESALLAESELADARQALSDAEAKEAEEQHKGRVRDALAEAVSAQDICKLRTAIAEGESALLAESELADARQALSDAEAQEAEQQLKGRVRDALAAAVNARDISMLRTAISDGESALLAESELAEAKQVLSDAEAKEAEEQFQGRVRDALAAAVSARDIRMLRTAISDGESALLPESELAEAKRVLSDAEAKETEDEHKRRVREALAAAVSARDISTLRAAIAEGASASLEEGELAEARQVLADEEAKEARRNAASASLKDAVDARNIEGLKSAIAEAVPAGVSEAELAEARNALAEEEKKEAAQISARSALDAAIQARHIDQLRSAIAEGEAALLPNDALADARAALADEETKEAAKMSARSSLEAAVQAQDIHQLRTAIAEGEAASLTDGELAEARAALVDEETKEAARIAARSSLTAAVQSRDIDQLRSAIAEGERVLLPDHDLVEARAALAEEESEEERRTSAQKALKEAVETRDLEGLKSAIALGESAGLAETELEEARQALAEEEVKEAARKAARSSLEAAVGARDMDMLRTAIAEGEAAGLADHDMGEAKAVLADEEAKEARKANAQNALKEALESRDLELLRSAVAEGEAAGVAEEDLDEPRVALAEEETKESARNAARDALKAAAQVRDMDQLRSAIAEGAAVLQDHELEEARVALAEEEAKEAARNAARSGLNAAVQARDMDQLRSAIADGEAVLLQGHELEAARVALAEEEEKDRRRTNAQALLRQAMEARDIEALKSAIAECESAGVPEASLEEARELLAEEDAKDAARHAARSALKAAVQARSIEQLRSAIAAGEAVLVGKAQTPGSKKKGIHFLVDDPDLEEARVVLAEEEEKERRIQKARTSLAEAVAARHIDRLNSAIAAAESIGLDESELEEARSVLAEEEAKAAAARQKAAKDILADKVWVCCICTKINGAEAEECMQCCAGRPDRAEGLGLGWSPLADELHEKSDENPVPADDKDASTSPVEASAAAQPASEEKRALEAAAAVESAERASSEEATAGTAVAVESAQPISVDKTGEVSEQVLLDEAAEDDAHAAVVTEGSAAKLDEPEGVKPTSEEEIPPEGVEQATRSVPEGGPLGESMGAEAVERAEVEQGAQTAVANPVSGQAVTPEHQEQAARDVPQDGPSGVCTQADAAQTEEVDPGVQSGAFGDEGCQVAEDQGASVKDPEAEAAPVASEKAQETTAASSAASKIDDQGEGDATQVHESEQHGTPSHKAAAQPVDEESIPKPLEKHGIAETIAEDNIEAPAAQQVEEEKAVDLDPALENTAAGVEAEASTSAEVEADGSAEKTDAVPSSANDRDASATPAEPQEKMLDASDVADEKAVPDADHVATKRAELDKDAEGAGEDASRPANAENDEEIAHPGVPDKTSVEENAEAGQEMILQQSEEKATPPDELQAEASGAQQSIEEPKEDKAIVAARKAEQSLAQAEAPRDTEIEMEQWEVTLTKREGLAKYGFSHVNWKSYFVTRMKECGIHPLPGNDGPELLFVKRVKPGTLLGEWNLKHPDKEVRVGDFICAVNGCATVENMMHALHAKSAQLQMVRYPDYFHVDLVRREDCKKLGFRFAKYNEMRALRVTELTDGLLREANEARLAQSLYHLLVLPNMWIDTVNGIQEDQAQMLEELRNAQQISLRFKRDMLEQEGGRSFVPSAPSTAASTALPTPIGSPRQEQKLATSGANTNVFSPKVDHSEAKGGLMPIAEDAEAAVEEAAAAESPQKTVEDSVSPSFAAGAGFSSADSRSGAQASGSSGSASSSSRPQPGAPLLAPAAREQVLGLPPGDGGNLASKRTFAAALAPTPGSSSNQARRFMPMSASSASSTPSSVGAAPVPQARGFPMSKGQRRRGF